MLLDIEKINNNRKRKNIIRKIVHVLFSCTREIDIKGWFDHDSIIGIIFTEINGADENSLKDKIISHLCNVLNVDQVNNIEITCYPFPIDHDKQKSDNAQDLHFYPDVSKRNSSQKIPFFFKRGLDILGSIIALFIFSPLLLIIAFLIKLSSKGPILFRQERVGPCMGKFTFLKFRTMYSDSDPKVHEEYIKQLIEKEKSYSVKNGNNIQEFIYKINDDPRVTPFGRFLRKTSLDELPQFINVLKGEMSLVGPRPPIPYELQHYDIWHRCRVFGVKPGITGLWQVRGRSSTTFNEMVRLDLKYIREWSLWLDMKILLKTPWAVISGKGAY
jgi:exopolysaccharide biosynthesis polyprenyl glycosylphosphotransferase